MRLANWEEIQLATIRQDAYEEGYEEGYRKGRLKGYAELVKTGVITLAQAAERFETTEAEFLEKAAEFRIDLRQTPRRSD